MRPPPLTSTGPPPAAPDSSAPAVLQALRDAPSRDAVVRHALRGLRAVAERVAVFAVKRDGYQGWACNVAFGDEEALRRVKIPHDQPSLLATAAAAGTYLGPVPATPVHASLLEVMERASADVAAVAVRAGGRVAMIFVADDLDDTMRGTRRMDALARAAGEALARLVASRS